MLLANFFQCQQNESGYTLLGTIGMLGISLIGAGALLNGHAKNFKLLSYIQTQEKILFTYSSIQAALPALLSKKYPDQIPEQLEIEVPIFSRIGIRESFVKLNCSEVGHSINNNFNSDYQTITCSIQSSTHKQNHLEKKLKTQLKIIVWVKRKWALEIL